ncbi:hypothetical protein C8R43DRAFT_997690 [Mycena crocata]|nr:hypothetical protein C8R43DRAFT_997690 [Mycena crocata]
MSLPVLYIWPGQWGLLSADTPSLVAALYLQLTIPEKFNISYCTNPDLSPSGSLPFLVHDQQVASTVPSIIQYISGYQGEAFKAENIDAGLNSFQNSQKTAWCSHVGAKLGDLTSYMLYSLPDNWAKLTHPTLAYALPMPQRYYVPGRIRDSHRPRLEAAGLWNQQPIVPITGTDPKEKIAQTFQRDKVLQTARDCLDIYVRLLGENRFVYNDRLTTLDIVLAAHVLVILKPPFPDTLLPDLFAESYSTLVSHAERVLERSMQFSTLVQSSRSHSIWSLFPSLGLLGEKPVEKSEEGLRYERVSWGWAGLAFGSVTLYLITMGNPLQIVE